MLSSILRLWNLEFGAGSGAVILAFKLLMFKQHQNTSDNLQKHAKFIYIKSSVSIRIFLFRLIKTYLQTNLYN